MSIAASVIINRVQETLLDQTDTYWDTPELLDYLNAAITGLTLVKPDAFTITAQVALTTGTSTQTIPAAGYQFFDIVNNVSPTVMAVREIERNHLDNADPNWRSITANYIAHYFADVRNPEVFHVFPVPNVVVTVEMVYAATPPRLILTTDIISVDSVYENPLYHYTLGEAYSKNAKRGDVTKAQMYYNLFFTLLGQKQQVQVSYAPKVPDSK